MPFIAALRQAGATLRHACTRLPRQDAQRATRGLGVRGQAGRLRVNAAFRFEGTTVVAGWTTGDLGVCLREDGRELPSPPRAVQRPDVAKRLGLPQDSAVGFVFMVDGLREDAGLELAWKMPRGRRGGAQAIVLQHALPTQPRDWRSIGPALRDLVARHAPFTRTWETLVAQLEDDAAPPDACLGHLERALACGVSGRALAVGWCADSPGTVFWLQSTDGRVHPLDLAQRHFRADAFAHMRHHGSGARPEAGFAVVLENVDPRHGLRLRALDADGACTLGSVQCEKLARHLVDAATQLARLDVSAALDATRVETIETAMLAPLVAQQRREACTWPVHTFVAGVLPAAPVTSVVVPLFARRDFVEHQLLSLRGDEAFARHCELIYVVDDPRLLPAWKEDAAELAHAYGVPMRWVWGGANRGFAGANNLGAAFARGRHLLFMNSDVFPLRAGWVERLVAALDADPRLGAIGPRLLNPDGSIQHAGMAFRHRPDLGFWINHHPDAGLAPELDRHQQLARVDAVTGACLAVRRADFESVGGWDEGYLVGDFEDSDLCLKLQAHGLSIAYMPQVELVHLVRQSMQTLGDLRLRNLITTYNALRHQRRWPTWLPLAGAGAATGAMHARAA